MEDGYENIDGLFRDKLENFSPEPSEDIWGNINSRISTVKGKFFSWWQVAASIILVTSVGLALWLTSGDKEWIIAENDNIQNNENIIIEIPVLNQSADQEIITENMVSAQIEHEISEKPSQENIAEKVNNFNSLNNKELQNVNDAEIDRNSNNLQFLSGIENGLLATLPLDNSLKENYNSYGVISIQKNEKEKKSLWSIMSFGGQLSPNFSYRNAGTSDIGSTETALLTLSGGIYAEAKIFKKFYVKTGLYYLQFGNYQNDIWYREAFSNVNVRNYPWASFSVPEQEQVDNVAFDNSIGTITLNNNAIVESEGDAMILASNDDGKTYNLSDNQLYEEQYLDQDQNENSNIYEKLNAVAIQKFNNIEIPLIFRYNLINNKKIGINIITGFSANILTSSYVTIKEDKSIIGETINVNHYNVSGSFGIGLEYPIFSKMSITLEPTFKYFLNSINLDGYAKIYPYSFGMYSGIRYSL